MKKIIVGAIAALCIGGAQAQADVEGYCVVVNGVRLCPFAKAPEPVAQQQKVYVCFYIDAAGNVYLVEQDEPC